MPINCCFLYELRGDYMNTWQMLKELTENKNKVFKSDNEDGDIVIICYIREGGAFEFKLFEYGEYVTDNIILYPEDKWIEISNDEMKMFLSKLK